MARPGIEPRTYDLRVRCPTDCAMRPGLYIHVTLINTLPVRVNDITILLMVVTEADTAVNCLGRQPLFAFMLKMVSVNCIDREIGIIPLI